jgi:homoserine dehydrogenase
MTRPLSVAVAGLGTVGAGVLKLLRDNADIVAARAGRPIAVTAVSARDRNKDRGVPTTGLRWYEDPVALAADPAVDVIVELIGGSEGPARALVESAIAARKPVVTANKALMAVHGADLAAAAEAGNVPWRSRPRSPAASPSSKRSGRASPATGSPASPAF